MVAVDKADAGSDPGQRSQFVQYASVSLATVLSGLSTVLAWMSADSWALYWALVPALVAAAGGCVVGVVLGRSRRGSGRVLDHTIALSVLGISLISAPILSSLWALHITSRDEFSGSWDGQWASYAALLATCASWGLLIAMRPPVSARVVAAGRYRWGWIGAVAGLALAIVLSVAVPRVALHSMSVAKLATRNVAVTDRDGQVHNFVVGERAQAVLDCAKKWDGCSDPGFSYSDPANPGQPRGATAIQTRETVAEAALTLHAETALLSQRIACTLATALFLLPLVAFRRRPNVAPRR